MSVSAQGCQKRRVGFLRVKITGGCEPPDLLVKQEPGFSGRASTLKLLSYLSISRREGLRNAGVGNIIL